MAKLVLVNEFVTIGGVDLTTYCSEATIAFKVADLDVTNYGSAGWHERLGGLKEATITLKFYQDYAATLLDAVLFPFLGTSQTFELRPTQAARSTSNPAYTGSLIVLADNVITGKVGDVAHNDVTWMSTGVVLRQTA